MRKLLIVPVAVLSLLQLACGPSHVVVESPAPPPPPPAELSYQTFYDALSPYGEWIDDPGYGYVWMPNVGPDFKPYATNGNWVYTDEGWTWASGYSWGWAPFHYGRWFYQDGYGWMWMPGNEWAPAWVSWRQSPQYYGWAPLGPNVSVNVVAGAGYNPPTHYWCFVPQQYVTSPHVTKYYVAEQQNVTIINNTTIIHNTTIINNSVNNTRINNYAGGPDPAEVSRVTGVQLRPVAVRESNAPGQNQSSGAFAVYRPRISAAPQGNGGMAARPAPAHVQTLGSIHPSNTSHPSYEANAASPNRPANQGSSQPAAQNYSRPGNAGNGQPVNAGNAQPVNASNAQPANVSNAQPVNPGNTQPANASNAQPANPVRHSVDRGNPPKPVASPNSSASNSPGNNAGKGNVNGHPGQQQGNTAARKPRPSKGQKKQPNPNKPDQKSDEHHP